MWAPRDACTVRCIYVYTHMVHVKVYIYGNGSKDGGVLATLAQCAHACMYIRINSSC